MRDNLKVVGWKTRKSISEVIRELAVKTRKFFSSILLGLWQNETENMKL